MIEDGAQLSQPLVTHQHEEVLLGQVGRHRWIKTARAVLDGIKPVAGNRLAGRQRRPGELLRAQALHGIPIDCLISIDVGRLVFGKARPFRRAERHLERVDDPMTDVILNLENIGQIAIVAVAPEMSATFRIDELRGNAHALAGPADRAFEHGTHPQLAADGASAGPRPCGRPRLVSAVAFHTLRNCVKREAPIHYAIVDGMNVRDSLVHNYPPHWNGAPSQDPLVIRRNHQTSVASLDPSTVGPHSLLVSGPYKRAQTDQLGDPGSSICPDVL